MDSSAVKQSVMKQVLTEANMANARALIEASRPSAHPELAHTLSLKLQESCFEKCVPKPGGSLSSSEQTCLKTCMEKYMMAWNHVNSAYINRIRQEQGSH